MRRALFAGVIGIAIVVATSPVVTLTAARQASATRTIYVTATDGKNAPVAGLTPADFAVKEEGQLRDVVGAEIAKTPMQVVLMLDTSGLGLAAIRQGSGEFVHALQGRAQFAVITMGGQNLILVDFTSEPQTVFSGLLRMLARNSPPVYILDGLFEVAQTLQRREAVRAVIVAVATEGEELSNTLADVVLDAIERSGAQFYYIGMGPPSIQGRRPSVAAQRPADSTEYESGQRNAVIGSAPKNSGGRSEQSLQTSGIPTLLKQFAAELLGQYAVTYATDGRAGRLEVETRRKGVKVRARLRVGGATR